MSQASLSARPTMAPSIVRRPGNILRLSIAQALAGANSTLVYAAAAVVGHMLAPSKVLATLPISAYVVGMAVCTLPAGAVARRYGRRAAFLTGTGCGVIAGVLSSCAVVLSSFWLFCIGTSFGGAYGAVVLSYRFAAAECAPPERRARALAAVMAGGVFAGVIGPQLVTYTMELWQPYLFAATFLAQAAVATLSAFILAGVRLPKPTAADIAGGRPLAVIVRQPRFIVAMICGTVAYMLMNFLMTTAPLAMRLCGISQDASNLGLQWHVIAMYAPSFFTGRLIGRFGAPRVVGVGLALFATAGIAGLTGIDVTHFWLSLILLGLGWNFSWLGASALVLECHRPEERTRVQSFNDFVVFGMMAFGSFSAGGLLLIWGWDTVIWVSFLPLAVAIAALGFRALSRADFSALSRRARPGQPALSPSRPAESRPSTTARQQLRRASRNECSTTHYQTKGRTMITEIVVFDLPAGMTREDVLANYRRSAPNWRANPDLIRKNYLYDAERRKAGGVYLWRDMQAARRARDAAWLDRVRRTYGSEPVVQYFVTPLVVDNALGRTIAAADTDPATCEDEAG